MRSRIVNLILVIILITGLGLLVYPSFSDYWNSFHQSQVIAHYAEDIANINEDRYAAVMSEAEEWNRKLADGEIIQSKTLTEDEIREYESVLDPVGSGMMGYIEIPSISCYLGIYHGTSEAVLQIATGHLEWSSLPIGGASTHSVISGHRGLPSAKLFTDLAKLRMGDIFEISVLGETYTYAVDQISIVEPADLDELGVIEGKDFVTLVTCTPYGVNTHRLLVRGARIENISENALHFTSEAMQIDTVLVAAVMSVPILILLIVYTYASGSVSDARRRQIIKNRALERIRENRSVIGEDDAPDPQKYRKDSEAEKNGRKKKKRK